MAYVGDTGLGKEQHWLGKVAYVCGSSIWGMETEDNHEFEAMMAGSFEFRMSLSYRVRVCPNILHLTQKEIGSTFMVPRI